jgi:menaquinol-cytochrome c reductase iron-sulfur subunit
MSERTSRRGFWMAAIYGINTLIGAALALPAAAYLLMKPKSSAKGDFVQAADLTQMQVKKPEEVVFRRTRIDGWRVVNEKSTAWVVRTDEQNVVAYAPQCTHLGCAYHWDAQQMNFLCPCHTSVFSLDGTVVSGPAPRPLDRLVTKVESGKLLIGSQILKS